MTHLDVHTGGEVVTISADAAIDDAIRLLHEHHIRHLPVVRDGALVGIVSEGDILAGVGGHYSQDRVSTEDSTVAYAGPTAVHEIMTTDVITLPPEESIATAAKLMLERRIRAIVLVSDGSVAGIVTESDYLRRFFDETAIISEEVRRRPVADHMATELVTTSPSATVFELIRLMGRKMHHLPVVDDSGLVGILSDRDVRRALALDKIEQVTHPHQQFRLMEDVDAKRLMHREVQTTTPETTLADAAAQMTGNKIGALPVVDSGEVVGLITETDILRTSVESLDAE